MGIAASERAVDKIREERQVLSLCFLTDLVLFWLALKLAAIAVAPTLANVSVAALERDRLICLVLFAAASLVAGTSRTSRVTDRFDSVYYVLLALSAACVLSLALAALLPQGVRVISRRELVLGTLGGGVFLGVWRYLAAGFLIRFDALHRFFYVLGSPKEGQRIAHALKKDPTVWADARYITISALKERCRFREGKPETPFLIPEDAIIVSSELGREELVETLELCETHCRRVFLCPSQHDTVLFQHSRLLAIAGVPLLEVPSRQFSSPYLYVKRGVDVASAVLGLLLCAPILGIAAAAVGLTSRGGVFFRQERLGKDGRPIRIIKFRSMIAGAEDDPGHVRARKNDPRVTKVGRIIRRYKIDEIPQLVNVLKGDMSLIGPRPLWREFFNEHKEASLWERRLAVRPGLTSLAHVLSSSFFTPADLVRYDLIYISNLSFLTDLKVLFATARIVLSGKGGQ